MIWVRGQIVPDDALTISALDRTFEHGLGLFETLRTWGGRAVLLERHLNRMKNSAAQLGIPYAEADLPDANAAKALISAQGVEGDALLRITLTGGLATSGPATLWMRAAPVPAPSWKEGANVQLGGWTVNGFDPMTQHKSLNYWYRRIAYEQARSRGYDEVLSSSENWGLNRYWEGSRTNLFVVSGDTLKSPTTTGPIVPGVMRELVLECARGLPLEVVDDRFVARREILDADEVFLTNSVRGIIPVSWASQPLIREDPMPEPAFPPRRWDTPGKWTQLLSLKVSDWLHAEGRIP
jgi:branched-subunit amino acid aminotransferase/4-amino-4-deoxychorismate lyase